MVPKKRQCKNNIKYCTDTWWQYVLIRDLTVLYLQSSTIITSRHISNSYWRCFPGQGTHSNPKWPVPIDILLTQLRFYVPLDTKQVISETFPKPISWLGMEKQNLMQQKHALTNQKKCNTTQTQKAKAYRHFNHPPQHQLSQHPLWTQTEPSNINEVWSDSFTELPTS